jgi:hypothetical protein
VVVAVDHKEGKPWESLLHPCPHNWIKNSCTWGEKEPWLTLIDNKSIVPHVPTRKPGSGETNIAHVSLSLSLPPALSLSFTYLIRFLVIFFILPAPARPLI